MSSDRSRKARRLAREDESTRTEIAGEMESDVGFVRRPREMRL